MRVQGKSRMRQRLRHRQVSIVKPDVFSDESDRDLLFAAADGLHKVPPFRQIRRRSLNAELPADDAREVGCLKHQRCFVEIAQGLVFNDTVFPHVAEHGDLFYYAGVQLSVTSEHDDVRGDSHSLQLLDGVLGRFGLELIRAP